jgi:ankyrin repeat protein
LQRLKCVKLLLKAGVPLTMKDSSKQTVLHAAARSGQHFQLLRYVLQQWKDVYATDPKRRDGLEWRDRWFRTPVHWAVMNQRIEALVILLEMGCRPDPPNPKENRRSSAAIESPLEMCSRLYGNSDIGVTITKILYDAIAKKTKNSD